MIRTSIPRHEGDVETTRTPPGDTRCYSITVKRVFANIFGTLGYMSLLLQWLWAGLTLGYPLIASDQFQTVFLPKPTTPTEPALSVTVPDPIAIIFMILAVIFAVGVTIYMIIAVPRTIGRVGKKVTIKSAETIAPYVTHHKKVSKKRQKSLLERISWSVKFTLAILPLLAALLPVSSKLGLSASVVIGIAIICASFTLLWFMAQFIVAKIGGLDAKDIW